MVGESARSHRENDHRIENVVLIVMAWGEKMRKVGCLFYTMFLLQNLNSRFYTL